MCHRHCSKELDRTLQDTVQSVTTFGGKEVLFAGDFRQIIPVVPYGSRGQIVNAIFNSRLLYYSFQTARLTKHMRLQSLCKALLHLKKQCRFLIFCSKSSNGRSQQMQSTTLK